MKSISFISVLFAINVIFSGSSICQEQELQNTLTLKDCLQLAIQSNPALKPFSTEIRAQDGLLEQSKLKKNPQLSIEAENLLGSDEYRFFKGVETTVSVSQIIETANKRDKRIHTAELEKEKANLDYENTRLDILYATADAFIDVLSVQERILLEKEFQRISQEVFEISKVNVEAGLVSPIEMNRAKVVTDSLRIELNRTLREQETAKLALAAEWGSAKSNFSGLTGNLMDIPPLPDMERISKQLEDNLEIRLSGHDVRIKQSLLAVEKANAVPDIEAGAGVRYLAEAEDAAFVVSLSIPLPTANRNQGAIRAAGEWVKKAEETKITKEQSLRLSLQQLFLTLQQLHEEIQQTQKTILPEVQQSFASIQEGYRLGKFSYVSVLDAQRDFFDRKKDLLTAVQEYHKTFNRLQRLISNSGSNALTD